MRNVGLFEAKQKLSELVDRASHGEKIGITKRGKLAAVIVPATEKPDLKQVFDDIEQIRKQIIRSRKKFTAKELIEEGRI
jgi:prevent-host-death family protein